MSVEVVLIPVAIAAITAWKASRTDQDAAGRTVCHVSTRMRDQSLLGAALADTGATVHAEHDRLTADWLGVRAVFSRGADGIWAAHLTGDVDEQRAVDVVTAVDQAFGRAVQTAVVARLKQRAPEAGLRVEAQSVGDDDSVMLVLAVQGCT